jgi:hypothetical protein
MQRVPPPKEPRPKAPEKPIQQSPPFLNKPREELTRIMNSLKEQMYSRHQVSEKTLKEITQEIIDMVGNVVDPQDVRNLREVFRKIEKGIPCSEPTLNAKAEKIKKIIGGEIKPKEVIQFLREQLGL